MSTSAACPHCNHPLPLGVSDCPNCATQSFPVDHGFPKIGGYDVLAQIGAGGMGSVYLAEETALGRRVAIKVVSGKGTADEQSRARFLREARSLATIEHENVVRIYAFGDVEGQPYLAMEYVEGETLADRILRLGRLPIEEAARFMREILLALDAAWEKGIVHRDIKPSNVLLDRRSRIRVADFGLAKAAQAEGGGAALTQDGLIVGTPYYISPEQAQGQPADFRSDIYSCGILFYEMLVGEKPFEGTTPIAIVAKHLHEPLPSIRTKRPDVPNRVALLIERMTEKDPSRRGGSYAELIAFFEALLGITPSKPISATETFAAIPSPRRRIAVVPLVTAVVIIAALFSYQMLRVRRVTKEMSLPQPEERLVVAVTPFYGPDDDSAKEGRMMAALVERSIAARLGADHVKVIGIDETKEPLRSHEAARGLGSRVGAAVVVWGEAFALKNETEIQPYFTMVRHETLSDSMSDNSKETARAVDLKSSDPVAELSEQTTGITRVEAEAPNQIELRKTSAEGVGEMVSFLAGLHALYTQDEPKRALQFFDQAPKTADTLRHRAQAYLQLDDQANAMHTLEAALALDSKNAGSHAALADLYLLAGRFQDAVSHYGIAASSGEPYRTSYAILDGGLLFVREVYRHPEFTRDQLADTGYLLTVAPDTGVVKRRVRLPGAIREFEPGEKGFTVTYAADRDEKQIESVKVVEGLPTLPLPIGNLLLRMRGMKIAWALPENFTQEATGRIEEQAAHPRFHLGSKPVDRAPKSLPELEAALRVARNHDPTQPWHLFWLAETLLAEERKPEADAVMDQLIALESGATYNNYNFMGKWAERFGQRPWADRLYDKALRERKRLPQPIQFTTLIERLINVAFMRIHPEQKKDAERSYLLLRRAREASGPTEADHYAAAAWAGHFRRNGDLVRARAEEEFARFAAHHPFNFTSWATYADYTIGLLVASSFGLVASAIVLFVPRGGRRKLFWREVATDAMAVVPRRWLVVTIAFLSGGVIITIASALAGIMWPRWVLLGFLTIAALYVTSRSVSAPMIASLRKHARRVLLVAFLAWLVIALGAGMTLNRTYRLAELPIGVADSFGHPVIVADLEKRLTEHRTPALIYTTAVANDLGGNTERAKSLYAGLPADARAQRALSALGNGKPEPTMPSAAEMFAAFTTGAQPLPLHTSGDAPRLLAPLFNLGVISIVVITAGLILGCLLVPAAAPANPPRPATRRGRVTRKVAYFVLPGAFDLRRGSAARGVVMMTLLGFTLYLAVVMWKAFPVFRSPGIVTAINIPNVTSASPLPPDWSIRDLMFAPPFASLFWSIALIAVVLLIILHLTRIPAIRALYRDDKGSKEDTVPTLITPAPTARD